MKRLLRNFLACLFLASPAVSAQEPETPPEEIPSNPPVECDHCACYDWGSATLSIQGNQNARKQTKPGDGEDLKVVPDAEGRIKLTLAVTPIGSGECCTDIGIVARVSDQAGKIQDFSGMTIELTEREWAFPLDIRYYAKKNSVSTVPADAIPCAKYRVTKGDCESGCHEVCKVTADPSGKVSSVKFTIPVGVSKFGDQDAFIEAHFDTLPNPGRAALKLVAAPEITATVDATGMTSVASDSMKAIITDAGTGTDPNRYIITVSSDPANPGTSQFRTITVESPTANSLRVSTTFAGSTRVMEWTRTIPVAGTEVWTFTDGNGLRKIENTKTIVDPNNREERVKTWERDPLNSANYLLISDWKLTYAKLFHRWELVQEAVDPAGANLRSDWAYHLTDAGSGLLASHTRYDGHFENHYHSYDGLLGIHQSWIDSPFKNGATVMKESRSWNPATAELIQVTQVGTTVIGKTETTYTPLSKTVKVYSNSTNFTTTTTTYKDPAAGQGWGGKPERVTHPDGTITTYDYGTNGLGERTATVSTGAPSGAVVGEGTATTTTISKKGRVIASKTDAVGTGAPSILDHWVATIFDPSMKVTDDLGRIRKIEYFPLNAGGAPWTTSMTYNCCGVATETDRHGVTTSYTYDDLKRRVTSTRNGVVSHTVHAGLAANSHRYVAGGSPATANRIARQIRNLPGTTSTSFSPNPFFLIAGAIVPTTTTTTYQPAAGLSSRTVTTVPGGFTQTTDTFLDGRTASTYGALQPAMNYDYSVDGTGLVTTSSYPGNLEITVTTSDWAGRTATVTRGGQTTQYAYQPNGQVKSITDPDNVRTLFAYNSRGERTTTALDADTAGAGVGVINYNGLDQITVTESTPGTYAGEKVMTTTTKVYAADNNGTATTVSTSHQTHDGLLSWTITPGIANPAQLEIDKTIWSQKSTAPDGTYSISTINADGLAAAVEHYSAGSPATLIARVDYTYDTLKRPSTTVDSRTGTTTTTYVSTTCDAVRTVTDPGSRVTTFAYDSRGRRITTTLPDTTVAHTSYYPHNQVKATWGSQSYPTFITYDHAHRRKELHTWGTAPALNQATATPPAGSSVTTWNYSTVTGYLTSKKDAANKGADYEYTNAGRPWKRTWARGGATIYTYTAGRLTNTDYPAGTPDVTTQYNRLGQPRFVTQTAQSEIEYTYDPATFALDTEIVRYDLDQNGNFTDAADQTRTLDRSLDTLGRSNGWQLKDPSNAIENRVDYTFDTAGRLSTVADTTNTFTYGYQYNQATATDPRVGSTTGTKQDFMPYTLTKGGSPVLETVRTYEARRDALAVIANTAGGITRSSYTYTVNSIGQRTGLTTSFTLGGGLGGNPGGTNWLYDSLGQLESADAPETEPSADADRYFQYDAIGNRKLSRTDTSINSAGTLTEYFGLVTSGTPSLPGGNTLNQYAGITKAGSTLEPVHDDDGNATSYPLPAHNSVSTLAWDAENRLTSVTVNGVTTSYRYDALSRRIAKITGGVTTLYRYDGWNCIAEYTGSATLSEIRTWGLDLSGSGQGAGGVGGLLAEKTGGTYYYPTFDGNGNVSEYLNANGDTIAHFEYDPFGNTVVNGGSTSLFNYRFSTKPLDSETGLLYYGYRYYDPVTGRWPARDPLAENGGPNLFGFVGNNGVSRIDGLGLTAYKLGNDDPEVPVDKGMGGAATYGTEAPTLEALAQLPLIHAALNGLEGSLPEAVAHVRHYLGGSGAEYPVNVKKMHNEVPSAQLNFETEYDEAMRFAESLQDGSHSITSSQTTAGYNGQNESLNWFWAVGGYQYWGKGPVTICRGNSNHNRLGGFEFQMTFSFKVSDQYNWNPGQSVFHGLIPDEFLGKFHLMGLAQEFPLRGLRTITLRWNEGGEPEITEGLLPSGTGSVSGGATSQGGSIDSIPFPIPNIVNQPLPGSPVLPGLFPIDGGVGVGIIWNY